jgi:plasmid stability protein
MQYTIRNVPDYLDEALRVSARREGKSLNEVVLAALVRGAGLAERKRIKRDLSDIVGTWQEDPAFESAIADQQKIDEAMWQ